MLITKGRVSLLLIILATHAHAQNIIRQTCGDDDFRCYDGRCIKSTSRCDRIGDCPSNEDELNCECTNKEFRCVDNGLCIELSKHCDGVNNCGDASDERDCDACNSDEWQCDHGYCIKRNKRCNGRVDCPTDRSDERNCQASNGYFRCSSGDYIPNNLRCNREYDCPRGDYSDEQNCPCGENDFKCDNGFCIPSSKHCDRTHDCQDGSDERDCTYGTVCMAYQYKCSSGQCVPSESWCNGTTECDDKSDESNCPCKRGQHQCREGSCINAGLLCDGKKDCPIYGEDEANCADPTPMGCLFNEFVCPNGGKCAKPCNNVPECEEGEDEEGCMEDCNYECDGKCLIESQVCDGVPDCLDESDESLCMACDGTNDYRCKTGECINRFQHCNGLKDCSDGSDEENCTVIVTAVPQTCAEGQFQCRDGQCINNQFYCDGHADCVDSSDEQYCPWFAKRPSRTSSPAPCQDSEFTCNDGRCIPHQHRCDNMYDCTDFSDEQNCYNSGTECSPGYFQCESIYQCIPPELYCNGQYDCRDNSDEENCPSATTHLPLPEPTRPQDRPTPSTPTQTEHNEADGCSSYEWRCENGPCIDRSLRCNGRFDCPYDNSDELDCAASRYPTHVLNLKTYPNEQVVRDGGDVVFFCRDEGSARARVQWKRKDGRPLPPGTIQNRGRLELYKVTLRDAGDYVCQAIDYLDQPDSEAIVDLTVVEEQTSRPLFACQPDEHTCGNRQCISSAAVCDGNYDCADKSDEDSCRSQGKCEPNAFQCNNNKCIFKTWMCDSENDCGDNSDEQNCDKSSGDYCLPVEFKCNSGNQCIPKSFHCDGQTDCMDGSDENCVPIHITSPPQPANIKLNPGDTLVLKCKAVGVPTPLISWRLNWGHVPDQCTSTSENGEGVLTCPNMQVENSGAYSCEAMNNKATSFATPDAIVFVNRTDDVCPPGYFNSEARSAGECIRCFCFGESTQCKSADLFTYNMPTPLGEGGTKLVGAILNELTGEINYDQSITDSYDYQPLRNGAIVSKMDSYGQPASESHVYLSLPETYRGNQLTSYGGHISYKVSPHYPSYTNDNVQPEIIIKGKYTTLTFKLPDNEPISEIKARLTPGVWHKDGPDGTQIATREDIMMALDLVEMILLRAENNGAGVNITEFNMESAQSFNSGLGSASLVEECKCPPGYEGLSCQKCSTGYVRESSGPWLGNCVPDRPECPPGTYGDPSSNYACRPCPCPLTNQDNQFARTCSLGPRGVVCDCDTGYEGNNCEQCSEGYEGNPMVHGDSCKPERPNYCSTAGTARVDGDTCQCKENVRGNYCDQCNEGSFYLSEDNSQGCALCFCSGVSQKCSSSNLRRKTTTVSFNVPQIVDQVKLYNSVPPGGALGATRYLAPVQTDVQLRIADGGINFRADRSSLPTVYYWSLPAIFAGDKVTSYGGRLSYTVKYFSALGAGKNNAADIQLISDNHLTFHYFGGFGPARDGYLNASVVLTEKGWQRSDGKEVTREHFLLALADVSTFLVKASYTTKAEMASLISASIETAEASSYGELAAEVEQCMCPMEYVGTSCEDCAPGYTRSTNGFYLEHCELCNCNGRSSMCHPETGVCSDCSGNTAGDNCELCKDGYEFDSNGNCVRSDEFTTRPTCDCDERGISRPCYGGLCECKQNVEGARCDRCRTATFDLTAADPLGCSSCYCSGVTSDCHLASDYYRMPIPAPIIGDDYGGFRLVSLNDDVPVSDQYVPITNESEIAYIFSETTRRGPGVELYWTIPALTGNRVLSYNGFLLYTLAFDTGYPEEVQPDRNVIFVGDDKMLYWNNPDVLTSPTRSVNRVPIREGEWFVLDSGVPATKTDLMSTLASLKRVLVRATLSENIVTTSIADVSIDTAINTNVPGAQPATGIEMCMCPEGFSGTSCESCKPGYYADAQGYCRQCNCNGFECELNSYDEVTCKCLQPYVGPDCSRTGLVMELHSNIDDGGNPGSLYRQVTFTCKYRAPEPLTVQFYHGDAPVTPPTYYYDSVLHKDGWRGANIWQTVWDTRNKETYECHTITQKGVKLGVLMSTLPEPGTDFPDTTTHSPPIQSPPIEIRISGPVLQITEIGSSVNFTCEAQSRNSQGRLPISWSKLDGYLPQGRSIVDYDYGTLIITNVQISDSGVYLCNSYDGAATAVVEATLKVSGNPMTAPTAQIQDAVKEYNEDDVVILECLVTGNPAPSVTWQRSGNLPLSLYHTIENQNLVIEGAKREDSGEYRCVATNRMGVAEATAVVTIRSQVEPTADTLSISPNAPSVDEGQSTTIMCTGSVNVPAGAIGWVRQDGTELLSNVRTDNGILYIDVAQLANQGVYICQASRSSAQPVPVLITVRQMTTQPVVEPSVNVLDNSITILTGETKKVDCLPKGNPMPVILWKKYDGNFGPSTTQRDNSLIIADAHDSDKGYYVCIGVLDGVEVAQAYVYVAIEIREAPEVSIWPDEREHAVVLDGQYEFLCRVTGIPEPLVVWHRSDGRPLSPYTEIQPGNMLRFQKIDVNDEGEYVCTATNSAGSKAASAYIKVRSQPEILLSESYVQAVYGEPISVICRGRGYPLPMVTISSNADNRELVGPSEGIVTLQISSATEQDSGEYTCTAANDAGIIKEQFAIRVTRGDGGNAVGPGEPEGGSTEPPTSDDSTIPKIGFEGKDAALSCDTSDGSDVVWKRVDRPLTWNTVTNGNKLIIKNATKSDSGIYECSVYNHRTGTQRALQVSLKVIALPVIRLIPQQQTVYPGQSPTVECVVEGDDIRDITWTSVDRPLSNRAEINGAVLTFHNIEIEDAGRYDCIATSRYANVTGTAEVIVNEFVDHVTRANTRAHPGSKVMLSCNVTSRDFRIRWNKDGGPVPRNARMKTDGTLVIKNVRKSDSGRYECVVRDRRGQRTSNFIQLIILGYECIESQFACSDGSDCIHKMYLCDGLEDCSDGSDERNCIVENRLTRTPMDMKYDNDTPAAQLVAIDKPVGGFNIGQNVSVTCKAPSQNININWQRVDTNQIVDTRVFAGGLVLVIINVHESDSGVYRCIGRDANGRTTYDDFNLQVLPEQPEQPEALTVFNARLRDPVMMPCTHNLEGPVSYMWTRESVPLSSDLKTDDSFLELPAVSASDAGVYVCHARGAYGSAAARAHLRVLGVLPRFDGHGWLSLPALRDAYRQFSIEVSFKPADFNGLIFYNSESQGRFGDFISLQLIDSRPQFIYKTASENSEPLYLYGDRPLQLNTWHTIRINKIDSKASMAVDNTGPFVNQTRDQWDLLDLVQPMYIGSVPDIEQLPEELAGAAGFIGCISLLILGNKEVNLMLDSLEKYNVLDCDNCAPNLCLNNGVCQDASNERGYVCLCPPEFPGRNCNRTGEACRPGLCGDGKCIESADGYKCSCPITATGRNCELQQFIEYPAFTGSAFMALLKSRGKHRVLRMSMKIRPSAPVTDGIVMYCAESARGHGGFTALTVREGRLEFRYDVGDGEPAIVTAKRPLQANDWTEVNIARIGGSVNLKIGSVEELTSRLNNQDRYMYLDTPMFIGGVDESIVLNNNTGVVGGFYGCITNITFYGTPVNLVNSSIISSNVQECSNSNYDRGDIPEVENVCKLCRNGGYCSAEGNECVCRPGFTGQYCETQLPRDPCQDRPCRNGGICRQNRAVRLNYTCDCLLGYGGAYCHKRVDLYQNVGFSGNGYLELPSRLIRFDQLDQYPAVLAMTVTTRDDGILFFQGEINTSPDYGDFWQLRVENGQVVLDWNLGGGEYSLTATDKYVNDDVEHLVFCKLYADGTMSLSVDHIARNGTSGVNGSEMSANSNIYIGGMPDVYNVNHYPWLTGCIGQVETMYSGRGIELGRVAVAGRNTQQCADIQRR